MLRWLRRDPKHLIERRDFISRTLANYPIYDPPHRQGPNYLRFVPGQSEEEYRMLANRFEERGLENFSYFLEHRDERLTALGTFLAKFGVQMGLDDLGLAEVSAWCPGNCGALVANLRDKAVSQVFFRLREPWTEQRRGFNVIFDVGLFLGECLIARRPLLRWGYVPGYSDDGSSNHRGLAIYGFKNPRKWLDPMQRIYTECANDELALRIGRTGRIVPWLVGTVRDFSNR